MRLELYPKEIHFRETKNLLLIFFIYVLWLKGKNSKRTTFKLKLSTMLIKVASFFPSQHTKREKFDLGTQYSKYWNDKFLNNVARTSFLKYLADNKKRDIHFSDDAANRYVRWHFFERDLDDEFDCKIFG